MGCPHSKRNTEPCFVYNVIEIYRSLIMNLDYNSKLMSGGQLKLTSSSVEYIPKDKKISSYIWPLKTIRQYGYEGLVFCFEAGRSSPYGQGIFSFKSKKAKQIFDAFKRELLKGDKQMFMAQDISFKVRRHFRRTSSHTNLCEKVHGEVQFGTLKHSNSDEYIYSPDIMESEDIFFSQPSSSSNVLDDYELTNIGTSSKINSPLPNEVITYTEVEIGECPLKKSDMDNQVTPLEPSDYKVIDFVQTKNLSRKMFKSTGEPGLIKTRHDFPLENSDYY